MAALARVASAGVVFIDSSDGIHIVQKIVLEDGTDANKPLAPARPLREVGSMGGVLYEGSFALGAGGGGSRLKA